VIAAVMGFGGGVLISALAFDLMDEAYRRGGFDSTAAGFLEGHSLVGLVTVAGFLAAFVLTKLGG
jgi:ZIP family zinc transporter